MANKKWGPFQLGAGRTLIMGVLNVTPDSFSDGGQFLEPDKAVEHACRMVADGADIIDIGGQSTRPGSDPVAPEAELRRLRPVLDKLAGKIAVPISIDTFEPQVAEAGLELGAAAINDVSGLRNPDMIDVVARHEAPVVLMHMRGTPKTMQQDISYRDVVEDLKTFFADRVGEAREKGVQEIMIDPGIGFGKTAQHNLEILKRLGEFKELGLPVLVGPSRKSFIGEITGQPAGQRLEGTLAAVSVAVMNGAAAVRVHDVKACKRAVLIADAVRKT